MVVFMVLCSMSGHCTFFADGFRRFIQVWWGIAERLGPKQYDFKGYVQFADLAGLTLSWARL